MPNLIFVYGTLRRGFRNEHYLENEKLLCDDAYSLHKGELLLFFDRPYIHFERERYPITGEIYEVSDSTMKKLDELEEHPIVYLKIKKLFYSKTLDQVLEADCYIVNQSEDRPFCKPHKNGDYAHFMSTYTGECALDWEVEKGRLVKVD